MALPIRRAASAAALLLLLALPSRAHACAACGCGDPSVSELGVPDTDAGGIIAGVSTQMSGERTGADSMTEERATADVYWQPVQPLRAFVRAPMVRRQIRGASRAGAGDVQAGAALEVLHGGFLSRGASLALTAEVDLPTGNNAGQPDDLGSGSGATRAGVGLLGFAHWRAWRGYASAQTFLSSPRRADRSQPGAARLANLGVQHAMPGSDAIDLTAELNLRDLDPDHWPLGARVDDTGGTTLFATPGVLATVGRAGTTFVRGSVQIPIAWDVYGSQRPGPVVEVGLFTRF